MYLRVRVGAGWGGVGWDWIGRGGVGLGEELGGKERFSSAVIMSM